MAIFYGTNGNDYIEGFNYEDNVFYNSPGDDVYVGGNMIDHVVLNGPVADYATNKISDGYWDVADFVGNDGADTLYNVERLHFADADFALDLNGATSAGGIFRLYQATFDRTPDLYGLGYWIEQADNGESAIEMAVNFTYSEEFKDLYGITANNYDIFMTGQDIDSIVYGFYEHVLHRAPDQGGLDYYVGVIESHEKAVGQVLAEISDSPENYDATIDLIGSAVEYLPWAG